ncbi:MAG: hypothetical protein WC222_08155 [Parachlamydiales bacterium]
MRKIAWISISLTLLLVMGLLLRDVFVGILLERHTAQTCGKLLGGECTFSHKEREGNTLILHNVSVKKQGVGSAEAQDIVVEWQYGWQPPFVLFDVRINKLRGDASMLPLYAVWRAVKHASGRKGIRLRSWSFDDIALKTPSGEVYLPAVKLSGDKGDVAVRAECIFPAKGTINFTSNTNGAFSIDMDKVSVPELYQFVSCWTGPGILPSIANLEGTISTQATYNSSGLAGNAWIHQLSTSSMALANVSIGISADKLLKDWEFKGQLGSAPLNFKAKIKQGFLTKVSGTLDGKSIPLNELLLLGGERYQDIPLDGVVDIDGEFDNEGLFASFTPNELIWKLGSSRISLKNHSEKPVLGKIWINFSKGIERLWVDLDHSHLSWGKKAETTLDGNIELFKDAVRLHNIKACCGNLVVEASLLGSTQNQGNTVLIAEGGKTKIGSWKVDHLEATFDPSFKLQGMRFEGKAKAANIQNDLRELGIEWKEAPAVPGRVWIEAVYAGNNKVELQGKWKSEPLSGKGTLQGNLQKDGKLSLTQMDVTVDFLPLGTIAQYSLDQKAPHPSYIDFDNKMVDIFGQWNLPGFKNKGSSSGAFHMIGPWKNIAFKSDLPPKMIDRLF